MDVSLLLLGENCYHGDWLQTFLNEVLATIICKIDCEMLCTPTWKWVSTQHQRFLAIHFGDLIHHMDVIIMWVPNPWNEFTIYWIMHSIQSKKLLHSLSRPVTRPLDLLEEQSFSWHFPNAPPIIDISSLLVNHFSHENQCLSESFVKHSSQADKNWSST
jgi:hypothetical protein